MDYQLFQELILENYRNPRHKGSLENPDFYASEANPLCGDTLRLYVRLADGKIRDVYFDGAGCAISQASASLLTEFLEGKTVEEAGKTSTQDIMQLLGGIELSPARLKCAFLSLETLKKALANKQG